MKVSVIGAGPAGMMAAITAASRGHKVTLLEKNDRLGKKLSITGGGRCNLCYKAEPEELLKQVNANSSFLYSAFYAFGSDALMDFFESRNVALKVEDGRVFPKSDRAEDVVKALEKALHDASVTVKLNYPIKNMEKLLKESEAVVLATGGLSYPNTGSTGDGYAWAREFGHTITDLRPGLVPLFTEGTKDLAGLSLQNVGLFNEVGELLFTHKGISGPLALKASRYIDGKSEISIDLMPNLSHEEVDKLLLAAFDDSPNKAVRNILSDYLPKRLSPLLVKDKEKKANALSKAERRALSAAIKKLTFKLVGSGGFREAVITIGGVDVREVNPSTMESKKVPGLYFAGEILDLDAQTGGFNLQIAFSTAYLAGYSI